MTMVNLIYAIKRLLPEKKEVQECELSLVCRGRENITQWREVCSTGKTAYQECEYWAGGNQ